MLRIIYEPKGRAAEYAPLAVNLFRGCSHQCSYCYVPRALHLTAPAWAKQGAAMQAKPDVLARLAADAAQLQDADDEREILLCFACDPYPVGRPELGAVTSEALEILGAHQLRATVLTKGGMAAARSFGAMKTYGIRFGTSLVWCEDELRQEFEPHAASVENRVRAIEVAHDMGIATWASIEPVIDPREAWGVIEGLAGRRVVQEIKVGPPNHDRGLMFQMTARQWEEWIQNVRQVCREHEVAVYFKRDMLKLAGIEPAKV